MLRLAPLVALACLCLPAAEASAAGCSQHALHDLQQLAPDGYAIYAAISDKKFFLQWITCDNVQVGLATAVHESVHHLTEDRDAYPLIGDKGEVKRPHEVSKFTAPATIAKSFSDGRGLFRNLLVSTYLQRGSASSADDFLYLLDELNAYSHDLHAAVALNSLHAANESIGERDGLAAMMAFVGVYVAAAEESQSRHLGGSAQTRSRRSHRDALDASRKYDGRFVRHRQPRPTRRLLHDEALRRQAPVFIAKNPRTSARLPQGVLAKGNRGRFPGLRIQADDLRVTMVRAGNTLATFTTSVR